MTPREPQGTARQLHLNAIYSAAGGYLGGWRWPGEPATAGLDFPFLLEQVRKLEAAKFDAVFIADLLAVPDSHPDVIERVATVNDSFEPVTLLAALAARTERIGLVGTVSTTYSEPYTVAREFASLDHLSGGRAGWNVVTSLIEAEARNFGLDAHPEHDTRYRRAEEFLETVYGLWDSFDDEAYVWDAVDGRAFREESIHWLNHTGEFFKVSGPLNLARPPQGRPVIAQAGASEAGRALAARHGEYIFSGARTLPDAVEYATDLRRRASEAGRDPDGIRGFPLLSAVVAPTRAEAEDRYASLTALLHERVALGDLEYWLGDVDLASLDLDGPLPEIPPTNKSHSHQRALLETARRERLTIRQFVQRNIAAVDHLRVGTPTEIADHIEEWFEAGAADGFNVSFPYLPEGVDEFVGLVVPELRRRGLFRSEYAGSTLREHLGLARPESRYRQGASVGA